MSQPHPHFATVEHIFEALTGAQIMHTISRFKSWEVRSPELQTVLNLELKRRSYGHLKKNCAKLNENVAAAPHFTTIGHIFEALPRAQIMHTISCFKA